MKKFVKTTQNQDNFTPTPPKNGVFDLSNLLTFLPQILKILPKFDLNSVFGAKNSTQKQPQVPPKPQNFSQNKEYAQKQLEKHFLAVKSLKENRK